MEVRERIRYQECDCERTIYGIKVETETQLALFKNMPRKRKSEELKWINGYLTVLITQTKLVTQEFGPPIHEFYEIFFCFFVFVLKLSHFLRKALPNHTNMIVSKTNRKY